jgi:hypothetical protein
VQRKNGRQSAEPLDLLGALVLVVGAHAMAVHGIPRATGDLGVWIARDQR